MLELGLKDKRALVVGAGPGLGRSCARGLAEAGARLICADIDGSRAEAVAGELRRASTEARALAADVRRPGEAERAVAAAVEAFGGLDVVVDVIGEIRWGPAVELSDEDWDYSLEATLGQVFRLARAAGRRFLYQGTGGSLVSVSSVSGLASAPFHAPYGAAKAGLLSLTRSLAVELAPAAVRVNCVVPGAVATPRVVTRMSGSWDPEAPPPPSRAPMGRMGHPDEIAKAVVFLSSDLASYVTGHGLVVDGGASAEFVMGAVDPATIPDNATLEQPAP